ncbi:two-component sensor histidine kinase [Leucobacter tardus]|uniref:Two-component sensor histidine kinase n=2 Tax=Leucobacter tardus TaxID=501483 RepID=A0A939QB22_9MICO|nr:two-component sensor histidine kinase [Leucobacter tardus]
MLAVTLVPVTPVLFGALPLDIPRAAWIAIYAVLVLAVIGAFWGVGDRWWPRISFGIVVVASWALVLTATHTGLLPVLFVVTVALSPYLVPVWVGIGLVVANSAVLTVALLSVPDRSGSLADGWGELALGLGFYIMIQAASLLSSVAMLREQHARRELAEAHVELQAATVLLAESARVNERLRISRDLHDLIGHQLTVLTLELEAAKHRAGASADAAVAVSAHVERAGGVARDLLSSVRETVGELRTESTDLAETLQRIVQDLREPRVELDIDADLALDEDRTQLLVRAVQEIVTNTIRHAEARTLRIAVQATPTGIELRAHDDGWGAGDVEPGNGLRGLRERFAAFGGDVSFDGSRGFTVVARAER